MGEPIMEAIPWKSISNPKEFVSFSSPSSSTRMIDLSDAKHAMDKPNIAEYVIKSSYLAKMGTKAVRMPPTVRAILLMNKASTLGLSDTQPLKTRPKVLNTPISAK